MQKFHKRFAGFLTTRLRKILLNQCADLEETNYKSRNLREMRNERHFGVCPKREPNNATVLQHIKIQGSFRSEPRSYIN
jgi:hypothetical protein